MNKKQWPLNINPNADDMAHSRGFSHWSCATANSTACWIRIDGYIAWHDIGTELRHVLLKADEDVPLGGFILTDNDISFGDILDICAAHEMLNTLVSNLTNMGLTELLCRVAEVRGRLDDITKNAGNYAHAIAYDRMLYWDDIKNPD